MIYFVDEDMSALGAWMLALELRHHVVRPLPNADVAFDRLCEADASGIDLVIIDVMLAVDPETTRFDLGRTSSYLETGLRLLEDLCPQNPRVFPDRAVLLTNTTTQGILKAAQKTSHRFEIPLWRKSAIDSPSSFADLVEARLLALNAD
jgi:hypothetical protein